MQKITLDVCGSPASCEIEFVPNFFALVKKIENLIAGRNFLISTDFTCFEIFKNTVFRRFPSEKIAKIPPGEKHKNWQAVEKITDAGFEQLLDRQSVFVAVGGGVVGDITGFSASIFMRGVAFFQVPTTLLAMVDASVGGKTGIDNKFGKNMLGAFHRPEAVICCREFLETLPPEEIKNGLAEMIKHGILGSKTHFERIEQVGDDFGEDFSQEFLEKIFELARDSILIKKSVVERDERESGVRCHLNLGHTFGHAIEILSNFQIPHGRAVAIGTVFAAKFALEQKICEKSTVCRIERIFEKFGIDTSNNFSEKEIWQKILRDKKRRNGKINLILPKKIGEVEVFPVEI